MFGIRSRRWKTSLALAGMGSVGFALGVWQAHPAAVFAEPPPVVPAAATGQGSEYSQRVVAYIHGNIPITREDLGEHLIARHGTAKLENLVNRKIIEHACKQKNISVSDAEVDAALNADLKQFNVDGPTFVKQFLKQYNKTLYEWKEDVIRPRLMLTRLSGLDIKVEEAEMRRAFDAMYGEKVQCRIIIWPSNLGLNPFHEAQRYWDEIRKSEASFDSKARSQAIPGLASVAGKIAPIGHGASEDKKDQVETIAFKLQKDEVSEIFEIPGQGYAVMKCDGRIPADTKRSFDSKEAKEFFHKQVYEEKLTKAIPQVFAKLKEQAKPLMLLEKVNTNPYVDRTASEEQKLLDEKPQVIPLPGGGPPMPPKP
jgi:PPIC-type PPIASE domain